MCSNRNVVKRRGRERRLARRNAEPQVLESSSQDSARTGRRRRTPACRRCDRSCGNTARKFQRRPGTPGGRERNESTGCVRCCDTFPHKPSSSGSAGSRHARRHVRGNASSRTRSRSDSIEGIARYSGASPIPSWASRSPSFIHCASEHHDRACRHSADQCRRFRKLTHDDFFNLRRERCDRNAPLRRKLDLHQLGDVIGWPILLTSKH